MRVTATTLAPVSLQFSRSPSVSGNQVQIDFDVTNYRAGTTFQLLKSGGLPGTWTGDSSAMFQNIVVGSKFRVTTLTGGAARMFYRLQAN